MIVESTDRTPEELDSIQECVEEILFSVRRAYVYSGFASAGERARLGVDLYNRIEAILLRAQRLSPEASSGNPPRSEPPAQPL